MKLTGKLLLALLVISVMLSGCYYKKEVKSGEIGILSADGVSLTGVTGTGRFSNGGWYADIHIINIEPRIVIWSDPSLVSRDKQPLSLTVTVTYRRTDDPEEIRRLWGRLNDLFMNDDVLEKMMLSRIPRAAKAVTTEYSLDEMLGIAVGSSGRAGMQDAIKAMLSESSKDVGIVIDDVGVNDIGVDEGYMQRLREKADAQAAVEVSVQRTLMLEEQLRQEKAQSEIALEVARRDNQVAMERAKVLQVSEEAYQIERLKAMATIFGANDKLVFVPQGTDLSLLFNAEGFLPLKDKE